MEFIAMLGVVFAIFIGLLLIVGVQNRAISDIELRTNEEHVCNYFATAVNAAHNGGSGFTAAITLPQNIGGLDYTLQTNNKTVIVTANTETVFCRMLTNQLNSTGPMPKGELTLANRNGTIFIE
jgi:hypothetical protein